jgi:hypothetical protein
MTSGQPLGVEAGVEGQLSASSFTPSPSLSGTFTCTAAAAVDWLPTSSVTRTPTVKAPAFG